MIRSFVAFLDAEPERWLAVWAAAGLVLLVAAVVVLEVIESAARARRTIDEGLAIVACRFSDCPLCGSGSEAGRAER